jgi:pyruvate ferredoxin oxidoreductase delta subunit
MIKEILVKPGSQIKTGAWRSRKPAVDKGKCTGCNLCVLHCPDSVIVLENKKATMDYEYCKGCGVCARICPVKAITMMEEK